MHGYHRRRSPLKIMIWCGAFLSLSLVLAWRFDWLPGGGESESPVEPNSEVVADANSAAGKTGATSGADAPFDPNVLRQQQEPDGRDVNMPKSFAGPAGKAPTVGFLTNGVPGSKSRDMSSRNPDRGTADVRHAGFQETTRDNSTPPAEILQKIDSLIRAGETRAAHKELSQIYWKQPQWRKAIRPRIEQTAKEIFFDNKRHFMRPYVVQPGDQLRTVARKYKLSYQYLERLNGVNAKQIRAGQTLKVLNGPFHAVVDVKARELTVHYHGYYVAKYPIGIGKDGKTPLGKHKIDDKLVNPTYTHTDERTGRQTRIPFGDPANPLGTRWLSIGRSFGIHGTNDPQSIGRAESAGCVRLHNADVEWVYDFLTVGSEVIIQQ